MPANTCGLQRGSCKGHIQKIYINRGARHCFQVILLVTIVHNGGFFNSSETMEFRKAPEILLNTNASI